MGVLVTKYGEKITKTLEVVNATCDVISAERNASGGYDVEYGYNGSDIDYDSMKQVERQIPGAMAKAPVYLTEDGEEYLETDLTLVECDESGEPIIWRNHYECPCGEKWDDEWSCQCDDDCPKCGTNCSPSESTSLINGYEGD